MKSEKTLTQGTKERVWDALNEVKDPEIPVVSVVEMGIVRKVEIWDEVEGEDERVVVTMTPTFAGCPALDVIREEIVSMLAGIGIANVEVKTVLTPPWSSDWITADAREKLKSIGLAPPMLHGGNVRLFFDQAVCCPYCGSMNTRVTNEFGPTLCRAIYVCRSCDQPFEKFKAL